MAALAAAAMAGAAASSQTPTFYRDVLPILQQHCQACHRPGEIAPFPLVAYADARSHATAIAKATGARAMPPWFADPGVGRFKNDPSLSAGQIHTLAAWAAAGMPAGDPRDAPPPRRFTRGWNIDPPQTVVRMPVPVRIPARGQLDYTYEIVPTGFAAGRWVQEAEIRPSSRSHVHHAVVYVRPPGSPWLQGAPLNRPFTARDLGQRSLWTDSEILLVYAPGSAPDRWPADLGKYVPPGSDLVFQMHYTTNGAAGADQTEIGLVFNPAPPARRVLTLQLTNDHFVIPPGADDTQVAVDGTLPGPATLLSFFPHMHLRGKAFEYDLVAPDGSAVPLLRISHYNFFWQRSYTLASPLPLAAGAKLRALAWYDNSAANPHNPDPTVAVRWGDQTTDEMMVGFFDLAVPAGLDKWRYFAQRKR